jgi:SAM-dependent methyltransferase
VEVATAAIRDCAPHEQMAYAFQTEARGLQTASTLGPALAKMSRTYAHYFKGLAIEAPALDLACGYGNMLHFLADCGVEAVGVDADPKQVALCQSLGLNAQVGDALEALRAARGLRFLSALDFIEHLEKDEAVALLRTAREALVPGGVLLLRLPSADGPFGAHDFANDITHKWVASANLMSSLLRATGFEVIRIHDDYPAPAHLKGVARYVAYRLTRAVLGLAVIGLGMTPPQIWTRSMWVTARKR